MDVIHAPANPSDNWILRRSTGAGFAAPVSAGFALPADAGVSVTEVSGDTIPDIVTGEGAGDYRVHGGPIPDLLTTVTDSFGNATSFAYTSITQSNYEVSGSYTAPNMAGPMQVVSTMSTSNGIGGTRSRSFTYYNARVSTRGRGFLGFAARRIVDSATGLIQRDTYSQVFPTTGRMLTSETRQSNDLTVVEKTTTTWTSTTNNAAIVVYPNFSTQDSHEVGGAYNGNKVRTVTSSIPSFSAQGGAPLVETTSVSEHATGNGIHAGASRTRVTEYRLPGGAGAGLFSDETQWCLGRPYWVSVSTSDTVIGGGGNNGTSLLTYTWDAAKCRLLSAGQPGADAHTVDEVIAYDAFGNATSQTVRGWDLGTTLVSTRVTTRNFGVTGKFLESETNPKGHITQLEWHQGLGLPTKNTAPNGALTQMTYDGFGQPLLQTLPDGTRIRIERQWCTLGDQYCGTNSPLARMQVTESRRRSDDQNLVFASRYTVLDSFGRPLREATLMPNGQYSFVDSTYDAKGTIAARSAPYFAGAAKYDTIYTHDALGRPTSVDAPSADTAGAARSVTSYVYEGLATLITDPEGKQKKIIRNASGDVVRVIDALGTAVEAIASYQPDALGNPRAITLPDNTAINLVYDRQGNVLSESDPNRGITTNQYYPTGELRRVRDAKTLAQFPAEWTMAMEYDSLGRITKREDFRFDGSAQTLTTSWVYDVQSATGSECTEGSSGGAGRGMLSAVSQSAPHSYSEIFCYDAIGRLKAKRVSILSEGAFGFQWEYSSTTGLLARMTYPFDGAIRVQADYNYSNGHLQQIRSPDGWQVFWGASRDAAGKLTTQYAYEQGSYSVNQGWQLDKATGRAKQFWSDYSDGYDNDLTLARYAYTWNKVGNLTLKRSLDVSFNPSPSLPSERYEYDDLYRLRFVRDFNQVLKEEIRYAGPNGNISFLQEHVSGLALNYTYHANRPHAVRCAGNNRYEYDTNGQMTVRAAQCATGTGGSPITWYSFGLPRRLEENSSGSRFSEFNYNPNRQRYKQVASVQGSQPWSETTISIDGLFERRTQTLNGQTKTSYQNFIMAEGRFAAVVKRESTFGAFAWFEPVTLDERGDVVALMGWGGTSQSFDAFGQRRDPSDWTGSGGSAHVYGGFEMGRRGFTGHEHIDSIGLIHMNGRVQHPLLGRMISPDPTIPYLYDTQSLNRYSYVRNNPITRVDPSGFLDCVIDSAARGCLQDLLNYIDSVTVTAERYPAWDSYSFEQIERLLARYMSDELRALEASMQALRGMEEVVVESTKPQRPQSQACFRPADNGFDFNDFVDFSAGLGDVLLLGFGDEIREFFDIGSVDKASAAYGAGEWTGSAALLATGVAGGIRAAGARGAGMEFSHAVPARMGGPRSIWNGNYVTTRTHALSDPYRFRFMPQAWKRANPMPGRASQLWTRTPNTIKGTAAGAGAAGAGLAGAGC